MPDGPVGMFALDLDAARDAFGLPAEADPADVDFTATEPDHPERRFFTVAAIALPHLAQPRPAPIHHALDHSRISAAVTNLQFGENGLTLIATDQPFEEIAAALEADGYERAGDVLSTDRWRVSDGMVYSHVAGSDDIVAMSHDPEGGAALVRATVAGDAPPSEGLRADLVAGLEAPLLAVSTPESECVRGFAVADRFDEAELTIVPRQPAIVSNFVGHSTAEDDRFPYVFGEPSVDDDRVHVPVSPDEGGRDRGDVFTTLFTGDLPASDLYDCQRADPAGTTTTTAAAPTPADFTGQEIHVSGSSIAAPIIETAADDFMPDTGATTVVDAAGTGVGFERLCNGEVDIAAASRPITDDEAAACARGNIDHVEVQIGRAEVESGEGYSVLYMYVSTADADEGQVVDAFVDHLLGRLSHFVQQQVGFYEPLSERDAATQVERWTNR